MGYAKPFRPPKKEDKAGGSWQLALIILVGILACIACPILIVLPIAAGICGIIGSVFNRD